MTSELKLIGTRSVVWEGKLCLNRPARLVVTNADTNMGMLAVCN